MCSHKHHKDLFPIRNPYNLLLEKGRHISVHVLNSHIDPKVVTNLALSQHPYVYMLYQHQFNLQCFKSGQELKTYHRNQTKKHHGLALVTDI